MVPPPPLRPLFPRSFLMQLTKFKMSEFRALRYAKSSKTKKNNNLVSCIKTERWAGGGGEVLGGLHFLFLFCKCVYTYD